MSHRFPLQCVLVLAMTVGASVGLTYEVVPAPEKGKPYPGDKQTLPYEDVLDISQVVLAGTVKSAADGRLELTAVQVLRGKFEARDVVVTFSGRFGEQEPEKDKPAVVLCLLGEDGALRMAADPPKGGGWVVEGRKLAEALIEAAKDPTKGFESKDPAVKISSAYRLARAWLAAPEGRRPKLPAGLVDALIDGLNPGDLSGRNVNAASRNAINLLLDCDISQLCRYSVTAPDADRSAWAEGVREAWAAAAVAAGKAGARAPAVDPPKGADAERVSKLIAQLGDDEWARREEAQGALRAMGRKVEAALEEGAKSKDAEISGRCAELLKALRNPRGGGETGEGAAVPAFDAKRVRALVEAGAL
ncbi:MAG TPA: hypothetical protein PK280_07790 [Planctomycetota bacterium]|nr:hypothetical protein [Planctomycetota bacterium]